MKRIALLIFIGFSLIACDEQVEPDPVGPVDPNAKDISLRVHVPPRSVLTYAGEDASLLENAIDSIFINLYQGTQVTPIHEGKFGGSDLVKQGNSLDSIIDISYTVDNITTGALRVEVFANRRAPEEISGEIPLPATGSPDTYFYMSGSDDLTLQDGAYHGEVHVVRNVAKLRINVSKNSVVIPSDLEIEYDKIKVQVMNARKNTTPFDGEMNSGIGYLNYAERTDAALRKGVGFDPINGGRLDSLYLYENLRDNSDWGSYDANGIPSNATYVKIVIPTKSASAGDVTATYYRSLYTALPTNDYSVKRNHIYTLDIRVRAQEPNAFISLDVLPWDDVPMDGSIYGTYLNLNTTEIEFDPETGEAYIDYCTDAQAIYFDFKEFNDNNTSKLGNEIKAIEIDTTLTNHGGFPLAPEGFKDAQILVDRQHCGTFGFKLNPDVFSDYSTVTFSGKICIKAGNIVQCLTFPARMKYDAHFIVGEPILNGEKFKRASSDATWMEVSTNRLYTTDAQQVKTPISPAAALYLHLDENLSGSERSGNLTLTNENDVVKIVRITQLPAIPVGRFGYNSPATLSDVDFNSGLYTEHLREYKSIPDERPSFIKTENSSYMPNNALFNGRIPATAHFSSTDYANSNNYFNYQNALYQAINYCAFKNRDNNRNGIISEDEIKWYLPSQAQLMGMWISNESYKDVPTSNFRGNNAYADIFWSSTDNTGYPNYAHTVDFLYGNVGHNTRAQKYWVRCVRNEEKGTATTMVSGDLGGPTINFNSGLPSGSIITATKNTSVLHTESSDLNKTVVAKLRVALSDYIDNGSVTHVFNGNICVNYQEGGATGWRLPTQRELWAIWILQDELKALPAYNSTFNILADDEYYWSATSASATVSSTTPISYSNAWIIHGRKTRPPMGADSGGGNAPHHLKTYLHRVRCVRDIP